jgi:hypothetical protein
MIIDSVNVNKLARFSRIGKIYKLIRLSKLAKFVRVMKIHNKFMKNLVEILKIGAGFERIFTLLVTFFLL